MRNYYSDLLTAKRIRPSIVADRNIITEAESDRGRLLFCPAFRRLQQKAQVFSLESNAAVRSRLTHSFEVSQIGRYIADQVTLGLVKNELASLEECAAMVTFVETACLMHDIGNPPFGHFGEAAIRSWFEKNGKKAIVDSVGEDVSTEDADVALADFLEFDGNPQGLRVVTKLQRNSDEFGLNLTLTSLASYLKYVRSSGENPQKNVPFSKKIGFFHTEREIVVRLWHHFGYTKPQRFPFAYIMEAADDIAYCISDLEDSIEKRILSTQTAFSEILDEWKSLTFSKGDLLAQEISTILENAKSGVTNDGRAFTFTDFRTSLNRFLVRFSATQYVARHSEILAGTLHSLITKDSAAGKILEILKTYCRTKVYRHRSIQRTELAGYTAIYGLLDRYSCLLACSNTRFQLARDFDNIHDEKEKPIVVENKLLSLFPRNYLETYDSDLKKLNSTASNYKTSEWSLRAHLIVDFISGMTDDFAMSTYQSLSGMKL